VVIFQLPLAKKTDLEKCNFWNFRSPVTLTLTLDRVIRHTVMHQSSTSIYIPNFIEIRKKNLQTDVWTDVPTDGWTFPSLMLLGRLKGVDLITNFLKKLATACWYGLSKEFYNIQTSTNKTRMWANAQRNGCPAKHRWRPLFNAAKFDWRPLLDAVQ